MVQRFGDLIVQRLPCPVLISTHKTFWQPQFRDYWNEEPIGPDGQLWPSNSGNDPVFNGISDPAQKASVVLDYAPVPGTTTGEVQTFWDIVMSLTPMYPDYPG